SRPVLNRPAPRPRYRRAPDGSGVWRKFFTPLADGQSWLDLLHTMVHWIIATVGWSFLITWWAGGLGGITNVAWEWSIPRGPDNESLNKLVGLPDTYADRVAAHTLIGIFFLVTLPLVVRLFAL